MPKSLLSAEMPPRIESKITEYHYYLKNLRALALNTISFYCVTAKNFLIWFNQRSNQENIKILSLQDLEDYICVVGKNVGHRTLFNRITALRSFLRFSFMHGEISTRLDIQIDTPRVYRDAKLPPTLDWNTVCALIQSIDRSTPIGKRDYAMLLLIATYGLRANEIVNLKLDHIEWRSMRLRINQHKTFKTLLLPLTKEAGEAIIEYLQHGRPMVPYREIFVRHMLPQGILKPIAVTDVFNSWCRRSGLLIPYQGPHCLRHSYAVHLLRQGISIQTIGGLLGHKNLQSTYIYMRLNLEDLRTVPLNIPICSLNEGENHE